MKFEHDVPLKDHTTMRLGGNAKYFTQVSTTKELEEVCQFADTNNLTMLVLGSGSNTIVRDSGFEGIVLINKITGFEAINEDDSSKTFKIGAGENWDMAVEKLVDMNLSGVEAMSAIPGTVGAGPIQNIGAYGQELVDTLVSVDVYDLEEKTFKTLSAQECELSYRNSIFRSTQEGRYVITFVTMKLSKTMTIAPPFYISLQKYFDDRNITAFSPKIVRDAIIEIRREKLPDPKLIPNSGSFFKNANVSQEKFEQIKSQYPDVPLFPLNPDSYKIPSGWLIEKAGFKGKEIGKMRVHDKNALILTNVSAEHYEDLAYAREIIVSKVKELFDITLHQEPLEI